MYYELLICTFFKQMTLWKVSFTSFLYIKKKRKRITYLNYNRTANEHLQ